MAMPLVSRRRTLMKIWKWWIIHEREGAKLEAKWDRLVEERNTWYECAGAYREIIEQTPELIANTEWPRPSADLTRRENVWDDELEILR
jgi:hypothetical protein